MAANLAESEARIVWGDLPAGALGRFREANRTITVSPVVAGDRGGTAVVVSHEIFHAQVPMDQRRIGTPAAVDACVDEEAHAFEWQTRVWLSLPDGLKAASPFGEFMGPLARAWQAGALPDVIRSSPGYRRQCALIGGRLRGATGGRRPGAADREPPTRAADREPRSLTGSRRPGAGAEPPVPVPSGPADRVEYASRGGLTCASSASPTPPRSPSGQRRSSSGTRRSTTSCWASPAGWCAPERGRGRPAGPPGAPTSPCWRTSATAPCSPSPCAPPTCSSSPASPPRRPPRRCPASPPTWRPAGDPGVAGDPLAPAALPGVLGPADLALAFAGRWRRSAAALSGGRWPCASTGSTGSPRSPASPAPCARRRRRDVPLVAAWLGAFQRDIGEPSGDPAGVAREAARSVAAGGGAPLAARSAPGRTLRRPRERAGVDGQRHRADPQRHPHRPGLHPAGRAPPATPAPPPPPSARPCSAAGRRFGFLFTDLANPTSNRIYQTIGYRPVADADEYRFARRPAARTPAAPLEGQRPPTPDDREESRVTDARPNILFIMTDDHAAHAMSCYGSRINDTPNLDRLAAEGMRFDNCFCTNSICAPSRASILTGTYSHVNGVTHPRREVRRAPGDLPQAAPGGAATRPRIVGKWHLGTAASTTPPASTTGTSCPARASTTTPN